MKRFVIFIFLLAISVIGQDYIHYSLGKKYAQSGDYELAVDEFRKVISVYPDHYNAYFELASIQKRQGNLSLAEYNFKNALKYNPGWKKPYLQLAEIYEKRGDYDNGVKMLQKARRNSTEAEKLKITNRIDRLVGRQRAEKKDTTESTNKTTATTKSSTKSTKAQTGKKIPKKVVVSKFAKEELDNAVRLYRDGVRNGDDKKLNQALGHIRKALKFSPGYPAAYYYAGVIRRKFGQNEMARVNFENAVNDPELGYNAHFYLGKIYGEMKNWEKAIEHLRFYRDATDYDPGKREALSMIENFQRQLDADKARKKVDVKEIADREITTELHDLPESRKLSEIEIRLDNLLSMVIVDTLTAEGQDMLKGVRHFNLDEFDKSVEAFYDVLEKYSRGTVAGYSIYNIGICRMKLHDWKGAAKMFRQYLDRFPEGKQAKNAQFLEALAYFEMKDATRAEKLLSKYIQENRGGDYTGKAYEKLGDLFVSQDDLNRAVDAYTNANKLGISIEDQIYALYKLGTTFMTLKNATQGLQQFENLIKVGESHKVLIRVPDSYYQIADYHYKAKELEKAKGKYEVAVRKYPEYKDTPWGYFQLGNINKNSGNYKDAIAKYDKVMVDFGDDYWAEQAKWKKKDAIWEHQYGSKEQVE